MKIDQRLAKHSPAEQRSGTAPVQTTAANSAAADLGAAPSPGQLAEVQFITGVGADGLTTKENFWTWAHNVPPTYDGTDSPHKWQGGKAGSSGGTVDYYFDPKSNWNAAEKQGWQAALDLWSAVTNIKFVEVTAADKATLTLIRNSEKVAYAQDTYNAVASGSVDLAKVTSGFVSVDPIEFGSVHDFASNGGFGIGTLVHELGHTLGLGHGGPYDGAHDPGTQQFGKYDSGLWTIMSYIDPNNDKAKYFKDYPVKGTNWPVDNARGPFTWMPLDILAAQKIYGKPTSTPLSGGQVFGFKCNITGPIKQYFDFNIDKHPVITLWDEGKGNTLDVSGFKDPSTINLKPGTFSSCDGLTNNIGIAFDTKIDKAVGGAGDDTFTVNSDGDTIDGGGGTNTVVFAGSSAEYTIADNSGAVTVTDSVAGRNGTVHLTNVTRLKFTDKTIDVPPPTGAVAAGVSPGIMAAALNPPGMTFISAAQGNETITLPAPGESADAISGFSPANGDVLDLRAALAGSAWNGIAADLTGFVTAQTAAGNTNLLVDPTGHGGGSLVAVLDGVTTSVPALLASHVLRV